MCLIKKTISRLIKHIISIVLVTTILLPFAAQLVHSFEKHEHSICYAQNKIHFDTHEIDCSVFHFKIKNNKIDFSSKINRSENLDKEEKIILIKDQIPSETPHFISLKSPPFLLT